MIRAIKIVVAMLCVVLPLTGCTGGKKSDGTRSEKVFTALTWRDEALEYDKAGQMRLAELYYKNAYELMHDNPSQDWLAYGDAGYRFACLCYQRGDMEGALAVVGEIFRRAESQDDFPAAIKTGLFSLMAQCQLHLAMPEAAKQTFAKAYENELSVSGGEKRGDFNLALMCANIFYAYFDFDEYDEAGKWLDRYEDELIACEQLGIGDSILIEEQKGSLALYKAQYLQATGRQREAAAVYAAIPHGRISMPANIMDAAGYLVAAGRYDEAAYWYEQFDSISLTTGGTKTTIDHIAANLCPRYSVYRKAGRNADALLLADSIGAVIDSALIWQKKNDAAELAVIYQTHEKERALEESEARAAVYRILALSLIVVLFVIFFALWRLSVAHCRELEKNREIFDLIQHEQQLEARHIQRIVRQPVRERTPNEQLFLRLVELMKNQQSYTDAELNRDTLARMLGTNHRYIDEVIRDCSDSQSTSAFINSYRVAHAARLLTDTDEPIALIAELSGFANRTSFNEQFRSRYKMTPSEFRKAAKV